MIKKMNKAQMARQLSRQKGLVKNIEPDGKSEDTRLEEKLKELSKIFKISNSSTGGDIA